MPTTQSIAAPKLHHYLDPSKGRQMTFPPTPEAAVEALKRKYHDDVSISDGSIIYRRSHVHEAIDACAAIFTRALEERDAKLKSLQAVADAWKGQTESMDELFASERAKVERLEKVLATGAQLDLPDFLNWMAERLVHIYGESPNVDFVLYMQERSCAARAALGGKEAGC